MSEIYGKDGGKGEVGCKEEKKQEKREKIESNEWKDDKLYAERWWEGDKTERNKINEYIIFLKSNLELRNEEKWEN